MHILDEPSKGSLDEEQIYLERPQFQLMDVMGYFERDDDDNFIIIKNSDGDLVDARGRLVNRRGYLIDSKENIINRQGQVVV